MWGRKGEPGTHCLRMGKPRDPQKNTQNDALAVTNKAIANVLHDVKVILITWKDAAI